MGGGRLSQYLNDRMNSGKATMKKPLKRLAVSGLLILSVGMTIFLPVFPWSARCRHVIKRVLERSEMRVAAWRGISPGLITLSGKLVARQQAVKGAEIEARFVAGR